MDDPAVGPPLASIHGDDSAESNNCSYVRGPLGWFCVTEGTQKVSHQVATGSLNEFTWRYKPTALLFHLLVGRAAMPSVSFKSLSRGAAYEELGAVGIAHLRVGGCSPFVLLDSMGWRLRRPVS
jgi:hypothetical protein